MSGPYATATSDDFTVSSNSATAEEIQASITDPSIEPEPAEGVEAVAEPVEESEATKAARTLAAQKKKNDPEKRKGSIQAEIDAETRRKHDAKREADAEAARLEQLRRDRAALEAGTKPSEPVQPAASTAPEFYTRPKPKVDEIGTKYADWDAYNEDLLDWKVDEREAKRDIQAQRTAAERFQREVAQKAQARVETFRATHPDYDEVVNAAFVPAGAPAGDSIALHLMHSDMGAELAYELGQNPTELARIAGLPPAFAIAALGRLEEKISLRSAAASPTGPAAEPSRRTKANPPIKPVGGSPVASDDGEVPDDLPIEEHVRRYNALDAKAARRR